ncbi:MAG: hypothetical protein J6S54_08270 [Lentisphaeria bacterium]|nr:hypothetical protein [Lentisphaeria bacterium]
MSLKEKMTALADAVREKAELTDTLTIDEMTAAITDLVVNGVEVDARTLTVTPSKSQQNFTSSELGENAYYGTVTVEPIPSEYITTDDATAVSSDIRNGKTAYVNGDRVVGSMPKATMVQNGTKVTVTAGFIDSGVLSIGKSYLETFGKNPITPGVSDIYIEYGIYIDYQVTIRGDRNLTSENIKAGTTIFNVEGTFTADADATDYDIAEGRTAYVNGRKLTGLMEKATATLSGNVVTIPRGFIAEAQTLTVPEAQAPTLSENTVTVYSGYIRETQTVTVGAAKGAETFTPGTSAITIPADTYLTGGQVIRGDGALISENIKAGVSIFDVEGSFTSDADAAASDIAAGKIAYVKGEKVIGTSSGGSVNPLWEKPGEKLKLAAPIPSCNTVQVPSRHLNDIFAYDGTLYCRNADYTYKGDAHPWSYVWSRGGTEALALAEGKLYRVYCETGWEITAVPLLQSLSNITQVAGLDWGLVLCAGGAVYGGTESKFARIEYRREKETDPVVYVNAGKILNCLQNSMNFWVIASNGDLVRCDLDKDSFDYTDNPKAYAEVDSSAAGNAFVNYFPQQSDGGEDSYSATYEFAFRTDGLWYRKTGTYWDGSNSRYHAWRKANDPGFRKTDWLGYCSTSASENWGWNEETGEEYVEWRISESQVALHIDTKGRLWKLSLAGTVIDSEFTPSGLNIVQVGTDTDWQCVPASVGRDMKNLFAQKGGKLLKLTTSDTDSITLSWEEFVIHPSGRMICCSGTDLWFAPEGTAVDLAKAGGTY